MRKSFAVVVCFVFALISCGEEKTAVVEPADLVDREKMVAVLADVHLLEAALSLPTSAPNLVRDRPPRLPGQPASMETAPPSFEKKEELGYYDIFKKHGVTREQYEQTMAWYTSHPEKLTVLYDDVITELTKRQATEQTKKK